MTNNDGGRSAQEPDIAELTALAKAATPGPWQHLPYDPRGKSKVGCVISPAGEAELGNWWVAATQWAPDAAFIAAASPDVVLGLLAALASGQTQLEAIELERRKLRILVDTAEAMAVLAQDAENSALRRIARLFNRQMKKAALGLGGAPHGEEEAS